MSNAVCLACNDCGFPPSDHSKFYCGRFGAPDFVIVQPDKEAEWRRLLDTVYAAMDGRTDAKEDEARNALSDFAEALS